MQLFCARELLVPVFVRPRRTWPALLSLASSPRQLSHPSRYARRTGCPTARALGKNGPAVAVSAMTVVAVVIAVIAVIVVIVVIVVIAVTVIAVTVVVVVVVVV